MVFTRKGHSSKYTELHTDSKMGGDSGDRRPGIILMPKSIGIPSQSISQGSIFFELKNAQKS